MINYNLLAQAQKWYTDCGFAHVEVPWRVPNEIIGITFPYPAAMWKIIDTNKGLIGSGEQGFLYQMAKGFLPQGPYQTTTPAFRNENQDTTHFKQFMKTELIYVCKSNDTDIVLKGRLNYLLNVARHFFQDELKLPVVVQEQPICSDPNTIGIYHGEAYDLTYIMPSGRQIELGSYGIRKYQNLTWVYGTGCAEPRTSYTLELYNGLPQESDKKG